MRLMIKPGKGFSALSNLREAVCGHLRSLQADWG